MRPISGNKTASTLTRTRGPASRTTHRWRREQLLRSKCQRWSRRTADRSRPQAKPQPASTRRACKVHASQYVVPTSGGAILEQRPRVRPGTVICAARTRAANHTHMPTHQRIDTPRQTHLLVVRGPQFLEGDIADARVLNRG